MERKITTARGKELIAKGSVVPVLSETVVVGESRVTVFEMSVSVGDLVGHQ
jgi:hypothetical protein